MFSHFFNIESFLNFCFISEWENGHCDRGEMETMEIRIQMRRLGGKGKVNRVPKRYKIADFNLSIRWIKNESVENFVLENLS